MLTPLHVDKIRVGMGGTMGKHGKDKIEADGQGTYDPDKTKPVEEAGSVCLETRLVLPAPLMRQGFLLINGGSSFNAELRIVRKRPYACARATGRSFNFTLFPLIVRWPGWHRCAYQLRTSVVVMSANFMRPKRG